MPSPAYERRNEQARALGYQSYYDYRVHGYGSSPPDAPVDPATRRALRGHAGLTELVQAINRDRNRPIEVQPWGMRRDADGRWEVIAVGAVFRRRDGGTYRLVYYLRGAAASSANLRALRDNLAAPGSRRPSGGAVRPQDTGITVSSDQGSGGDGGGEDGEGEDEDDHEGSYYDYYDEYDDYGEFEPIPYIAANSIGEFSA